MTEKEEEMIAFPEDFKPRQKVWFHGLKARVADKDTHEAFQDGIYESEWDFWAVPIVIKDSVTITIAHVDDLMPRKRGEAWI